MVEEVGQGIVQSELVPPGQQEDGVRGELLGVGCHVEDRLRGDGAADRQIGLPPPRLPDDAYPFADGCRTARAIRRRHQLLENIRAALLAVVAGRVCLRVCDTGQYDRDQGAPGGAPRHHPLHGHRLLPFLCRSTVAHRGVVGGTRAIDVTGWSEPVHTDGGNTHRAPLGRNCAR